MGNGIKPSVFRQVINKGIIVVEVVYWFFWGRSPIHQYVLVLKDIEKWKWNEKREVYVAFLVHKDNIHFFCNEWKGKFMLRKTEESMGSLECPNRSCQTKDDAFVPTWATVDGDFKVWEVCIG